MTHVMPAAPAESSSPPPAPDLQRQSLEQIVRLSIECTAEELRIEQQHTEGVKREDSLLGERLAAAKQRHERRLGELKHGVEHRTREIQEKYESQRQAAETAHEASVRQLARTREEKDSALKKQVEEACWQAESALVAAEMKIDTEEQAFKKEHEASLAELSSLAAVENAARQAVARYRVQLPVVEMPADAALAQRIAGDPKAVLADQRQQAAALLRDLQEHTRKSVMDDVVPLFCILVLALIAGAAGWMAPSDDRVRLWYALGAGGGAIILGMACWLILYYRKRARVRIRARELWTPLMQSLQTARKAATLDPEAAAAARERRVDEARRRRDQEAATARERGKAQLIQSAEQYRSALAEENARFKDHMTQLEEERERALGDLQRNREKSLHRIEEDDAAKRAEAQSHHASAMKGIESAYQSESQALHARWSEGLRALTELMTVGSGIDPALVDWNSPAWERWTSPAPAEYSPQIRFGEMKVDLAQLTEQIPQRLQLPGTFTVPAMLALPNRASMLLEADQSGRTAAIDVAKMVMARLLTELPAGRARFTIIDPVGLGQSFAGFMHLADHDEALVGSRIWTEKDHIAQRLADLTEHMETVIQKYLRNEYTTIDQYNAQAGELAEPFRFLVIADFPAGFDQDSIRRLSSIALSGPRCGVYTLILRDARQPIPPGSHIQDIVAHSLHLVWKDGGFLWDDAVFGRFPLRIDPSPDEKTLTRLMDRVGRAAKEAKRVEVPFQSIAPGPDQFWSQVSKNDLRVPIGKSGATRRQPLRLGVGVAQHALVAGKTGSGKSNLMHTIVTNLAMWFSPEEVEFYLVDFKKGVEFKAYVTSRLPHARAIAVESDREFGLSVLQRVDAELTRRGALLRDAGVQEISAYREKTGQKLPRCLLLIDEFQEFFSEDDKLSQEAAGLMDRLVRQGRAFGIHLILGSQTIGGSSGLARSTLGQIAVRIALQCSEADSQIILGDNNSAARLLSRPGEAVYNDAGGLVEANSPFQIAFLPDDQREEFLGKILALAEQREVSPAAPIVFEGNAAADIRKNQPLMNLLQRSSFPPAASAVPAYVGEPVAIKEPSAVRFRRQIGANVLMVGQQEQGALAILASAAISLAAQHAPGDAQFYLFDGTPADSPHYGMLERVLAALPQTRRAVSWRDVPATINDLAGILSSRQGNDLQAGGPAVYILVFGLQRFRLFRKQEEDFSFRRGDETEAPKTDRQLAEILAEGPAAGLHSLIWADTPITIERTFERATMRQFDYRILFQMSATDSSNLIDSPLANRLGAHRALLYSEEQGTVEKFRPYQLPDPHWLEFVAGHLRNRQA